MLKNRKKAIEVTNNDIGRSIDGTLSEQNGSGSIPAVFCPYSSPEIDPKLVQGQTHDIETDEMDKTIGKSIKEANQKYQEIVNRIVGISGGYLDNQQDGKSRLRKIFVIFFISLLSVQMVSIIVFVLISIFHGKISDTLLITYISEVFVETLSAIIIMIRFAFASKDEVNIINLLTAIVNEYQYIGKDSNSNSKQRE